MRVPFSYESVEEDLVGKKLVISSNKLGSNVFKAVAEIELKEGGAVDGGDEWSIESGVLKIDMDAQGGFYEFRGLESRNEIVYAAGIHSTEKGMQLRSTMHERVAIGSNFIVCISSHVKYEKETLPVILKSLRKAGFADNRVMVVVGGCPEEQDGDESEVDGVRIIRRKASAMGFTGLGDSAGEIGYRVLLHDTCVVDRDFEDKASQIDVGMNPDVVLFSVLDNGTELGLYSEAYLEKGIVELDERVSSMLKKVIDSATVVVEGISEMEDAGERDVYGSGIMRKIKTMSEVGVRKNVRKQGSTKKP